MFIQAPFFCLPPQGQPARKLAYLILVLAPVLCGLFALFLGQDGNWDLRNYHYYNAYAFLNGRYAQDLLPAQTPSFYSPLMDVPFYLMATHFPAKVVGFILGAFQGLNFVLLFLLAHAVLVVPNARQKVIVCTGLAVLGVLGGGGIAQIGTTFGDNMISLGALLSALLVARYWETLFKAPVLKAFKFAFLFGLPAGLAMGLKLPAVIYAVGLCGGLLFLGAGVKRGVVLSFAFGLGVLAGCAAAFGPWAFFLNENYGSPLFPYFNNVFHSPLAPPASARDVQYVPHSLSDIFLMPFLFAKSSFRVGEIDLRDWRLPILYVLLPLAVTLRLLFGRNRNAVDVSASPYPARYLFMAFALSYGVWLMLFSIYRYAVTLEMVAPILIVLAIGLLPLKISTRGLLSFFLLIVVAGSVKAGDWGRREAWLDRFVEVQIPNLGDTSNVMILMAGMEPYSHVIPSFPPEISFVRIQSNFSSPEENKGINKLLHERIDAHRKAGGRFMVLVPNWQVKGAGEAASYFGLKVMPKSCLKVTDRLFNDSPLSLCPVVNKE